MTQAQLKQVETLTLYAQPYDLDAQGYRTCSGNYKIRF